MAKQTFLKGPALFALARRKAAELGMDVGESKLVELVQRIQECEGHTSCFRARKECPHLSCCWQASCGAVMLGK